VQGYFTADLLQQGFFQNARRRQQLAAISVRGVAGGQIVEQLGQIFGDDRIAGQNAEIGIHSGCAAKHAAWSKMLAIYPAGFHI
jgi:hypothetical protein